MTRMIKHYTEQLPSSASLICEIKCAVKHVEDNLQPCFPWFLTTLEIISNELPAQNQINCYKFIQILEITSELQAKQMSSNKSERILRPQISIRALFQWNVTQLIQ